jgi:transcriptional regulator with XRE-family HTH domain
MYRNARAEMARAGVTLEILAEKSGKSVSVWSAKLNGRVTVTLDDAREFKRIVGTDEPIETLFERSEEAS